jgi:type IV pilus assembly protein PilA
MLEAMRKRLERDEDGFTLIELMVVVLIIAILIAIAVPTFLGARSRAQARQAQSNVRNAYSAEKTAFTDNQAFVSASAVQSSEPSLKFQTTASTAPKEIQVELADTLGTVVTSGVVCLNAKGADGNFYQIREISTGTNAGVSYFAGTAKLACDTTAQAAGGWTASW